MIKLKNFKIQWFHVLFVIIIFWNLTPYINTSLSCADDAEIYAHTTDNGINYATDIYAKNTGRFFVYFVSPFSRIPYLLNIYVAKAINIIFVLIGFLLLSHIVSILTKDKWIGFFSFLMLLTFLNVGQDHTPVLSYPWSFTLPFDLILSSLIFSHMYSVQQERKYIILTIILFTMGLMFYEIFLLFLPFAFFMSLNKSEINQNNTLKKKFIYLLKKSTPFLSLGFIYLICFFGYRIYNPPAYSGTSFSHHLSFTNVFETMLAYSRGAIPFYYINETSFYQETSDLLLNHKNNLLYFFQNAKLNWYIKAFIICYLSFYILKNIKNKKNNIKNLLVLFFIFLFYIFLPNLPLSLTDKYINNHWNHDAYIPTFYSFHFMMIAITILLSFTAYIKHKTIQNIVLTIVLSFIFIGSLSTDYINYNVMKNIRQTSYRFDCVNKFAESETFKALPKEAKILAPNLHSTSGRQNNTFDKNRPFKWHKYLKTKYNKTTSVYADINDFAEQYNSLNNNYYLKYTYNRKGFDQFIAFGKISNKAIESDTKKIYSDTVSCFYYSSNKQFTISFSVKPSQNNTSSYFIVNNKQFQLSGNYGQIKIKYKSYNDVFKPITIISSDIDINSVIIDDLTDMKEVDIEL